MEETVNDRTNPDKPDRPRISLDEDHELQYWTAELGVSKWELFSAVVAVGYETHSVRQYLAKQRDLAAYL